MKSLSIDIVRRTVLSGTMLVAAVALSAGLTAGNLIGAGPAFAADAKVLKLSHQFPAASGDEGDFRDMLAQKFATEVEKRTNGAIKVQIYPNASLMKSSAQFGALRKGLLDMSVLPLAYGGGEVPEVSLTLMPAMVTSYEQGLRWKDAPIGKELSRILDSKGIHILTWVWQAGGIASGSKPVVSPDDVKGMKIRGGSKEMDAAIMAAGGAVTNVPSNEIYNAMSTGVLDGALTSSTSLMSYRLEEVSKAVTTARNHTIWFMFEPLLISKAAWDGLTPDQRKIFTEVGASLEPFAVASAKADDAKLGDVYAKAGVKVVDMDEADFKKWVEIAKTSAYKEFASRVKNGQALVDMALAVK